MAREAVRVRLGGLWLHSDGNSSTYGVEAICEIGFTETCEAGFLNVEFLQFP
jgi:hypothetical protein